MGVYLKPGGRKGMLKQLCIFFLVAVVCVQGKSVRTRTILNRHTGTSATVEYSEQGIPFINAQTEHDLFYAQGYVITEQRLWQMEVFRRVALGTTAEIFGEPFVAIDMSFRRMQWTTIATTNMQNTPTKYLVLIQFYMNGVNAFLDDAMINPTLLPPEFAEYGAPFPAPFRVLDSFLLVKLLSTGLSGNARSEPGYQSILDEVGMNRYQQLMSRDPMMPYVIPPYHHSNYSKAGNNVQFKEHKNIIENFDLSDWAHSLTGSNKSLPFFDMLSHKKESNLEDVHSPLRKFLTMFKPEEWTHASNSWAISGEHTTTGMPFFANDPHLAYSAPMVWALVGLNLDAPDSKWNHIVGATLVLAPGIGIGRNDHISWGYTMVSADNQDLFIMDNLPGNLQYRYNGTIQNYDVINEQIFVKDQTEPVNATFLWSVYGPVIPDGETYYALHWTAQYSTEPSIQALIDQNTAQNYQEYVDAVEKWWSLCFNAVFADTQGNIGYHTTGAIPNRRKGDSGNLPNPGDGSRDWLGMIPYDSLPSVLNPPEGFIVSANNPVAPTSEEVIPIQGYFAVGFRAQRIIDMIMDSIDQGTKIDAAYISSIQGSVVNLEFSYLYDSVKNLVLTNSDDLNWQSKLLAWDGNELTTSKEATIFEDFSVCLGNVTFFEIGGSWNKPYFLAQVFNNATSSGAGDDLSCSMWNQTCLQYATSCFSSAVANYPIRVPEWGSLPHSATFLHLLPYPVEGYNRLVPVGGSAYTPNAAHSVGMIRGPVLAGPSMRLIADMSGTTPNQMILPMGESGVPTSPHYDDQLAMWAADQTVTVDWSLFSQ